VLVAAVLAVQGFTVKQPSVAAVAVLDIKTISLSHPAVRIPSLWAQPELEIQTHQHLAVSHLLLARLLLLVMVVRVVGQAQAQAAVTLAMVAATEATEALEVLTLMVAAVAVLAGMLVMVVMVELVRAVETVLLVAEAEAEAEEVIQVIVLQPLAGAALAFLGKDLMEQEALVTQVEVQALQQVVAVLVV
jgi:hypothetical protein